MNALMRTISPGATKMIRMDHTHVLATFHQFHADTPAPVKRAIANTVCLALEIHAQLEEEIFYPAVRAAQGDAAVLDKSVPEHDEMRRLIARLRELSPDNAEFDSTINELMRDVIHHVADEETVMLPDAERLIPDQLSELGARMTARRFELVKPKAGQIAANMIGAVPVKSMVLIAGLTLLGSFVAKRAFVDRA